ncbi:uncharacterized protein BCR38DRAFT_406765 [Pseudomassariella vexata]|uniref:Uncharacterized protein n=1 Tax=Pseudomassariella vexata TaxID=1141098 RepID=A0A1Y2EDJ8_9PEZI|nr:uncharacterized protein BCR38DRAFT_406765 [Pseudomassariella vexata]ORY68885.1 hypothetical protein BCR38DRAFT_406765 [Pseudomassariella vexata]
MYFTTSLAVLALTALSAASPAADTDSKRQNVEWDFKLFQTTGCTGAADRYSGAGDQACTAGIRNGNALAWIKTFVSADCEVTLFNDVNCNNLVDAFDEETEPEECTAPFDDEVIAAYEVVCD